MSGIYKLAWAAILILIGASPAAAWQYRLSSQGTLASYTAPVWDLRFSGSGQYLAVVTADDRLILYGAERQKLWDYQGDLSQASRLAFSAGDKYLALSAFANAQTLLVLDPASQRGVQQIRAHNQPITALAFSPGTDILVTAGWDKALKIWEWLGLEFQPRPVVILPEAVSAMAFDAEGYRLATASADGKLALWHWNEGKLVPKQQAILAEPVTDLAWGPQGEYLATAGVDGSLTLWHWPGDSLRIAHTVKAHSQRLNSLAFGPGGLLVTAGWDGAIKVWQVRQNRLVLVQILVEGGEPVNRVAFDPLKATFVSGGQDARIRLWGIKTCLFFICC